MAMYINEECERVGKQAGGQAGQHVGLFFCGFVFSSQTMCANLSAIVQGSTICGHVPVVLGYPGDPKCPVILGRKTRPVILGNPGDQGQKDEQESIGQAGQAILEVYTYIYIYVYMYICFLCIYISFMSMSRSLA